MENFYWTIANQKELQKIFLHQRKEIKLRKNRNEKLRQKSNLNKNNLKK